MAGTSVVLVVCGVIGCASARQLACAGLRVVLLERDGVGAEASGAAAVGHYPSRRVPCRRRERVVQG